MEPAFTLASRFPGGEGASGLGAWKQRVPGVEPVTIQSSADGAAQRAMFYDSGSPGKRPLIVVLHSWSTDWRQNIGIPYAMFARQNDWVFVHPDFRGPYLRPEAAASDLAVQDILDAVAYAKQRGHVDETRIYLAGFSGGGMTALAMAGRHPEVWAGVVAWAPVYDIPDWYVYNKKHAPKRHYARFIEGVCRGAPKPGTKAFEACKRRSPSALAARAKQAGVPVYVATGIRDDVVPPQHSISAFNDLADPADRVADDVLPKLRSQKATRRVSATSADDLYQRAGAPAYLTRTSGNATLVLFEGGHDVVFEAGLAWLRDRRRTTSKNP
ncbi:alpha/beta fold hydrolase [Polyangium spumosum]|uniref:alpha/beta fold hydrolase n=1 Tax=Polyangium spumosum TaxID=889282 RepID=UPI001478A1AA